MTIEELIDLLKLEISAQNERYAIDGGLSLKQLKAEGYVLQPIRVQRKQYGYADYPEFEFTLPYPAETNNFRNGSSIQLFVEGEKAINGILLYLEGNKGEIRLHAADFPDWLEEKNVGVQLIADQRTNEIQLNRLKEIKDSKEWGRMFQKWHASYNDSITSTTSFEGIQFENKQLNDSQKIAIENCLGTSDIELIHGPPGTGKTTTIVELITQLVKQGKRVLVSAPSNTAVDNIGMRLAALKKEFLRVGNNVKVREELSPYTVEGKMEETQLKQTIKKMRIQSEQYRKMAHQYKRKFGKEEREQRNLLLQEVKSIRKEIRDLQKHFEDSLYEKSPIILGTPIALYDATFKENEFDVLIVDEAGQCLEPLIWVVLPFAKRYVLAGDPFQLPPTVISEEAQRKGLAASLLERLMTNQFPSHLLTVQYRMKAVIAEFSNRYFYEGKLQSLEQLSDNEHLFFYDTAGADYTEQEDEQSASLYNKEELYFIRRLIQQESIDASKTVFITPYNGQLSQARELLADIPFQRMSTIDSFQGQEAETVILSLVRSNPDQKIGFLSDYRRINVALTRAQQKLYIIGDSATIGSDDFYAQLLDFLEEIGAYHSVYEVME
jgi:ATP-dependent RNA/DNA helicase IGHMBP2